MTKCCDCGLQSSRVSPGPDGPICDLCAIIQRYDFANCADCGRRLMVDYMEGKWCEDCFDIGLKADMHEHFVYTAKKEMEGFDV